MRIVFATVLLALVLQGCATAPLPHAAIKGDKTVIESLLDKGVKVDQTDSRGRTALYLAAQYGHKDIVELLLSKGANSTHRCLLEHGNTALHAAAQNGHDAIIELFLAANVSPDLRNHNRQTPLMIAAWARLPETVALLLAHGADPKLQDVNGWSVLHSDWQPKPGDSNYENVMQLLIDHKAPVNATGRNPYGFTPLMSACMVGDAKVVKLLLDAGAAVNVQDEYGQTPYRIATHTRNQSIISLLDEHGAITKPTFSSEPQKAGPVIPKSDH